VPVDRRHRRRQETIEQVLDVAVDVMTEYGVAGLSLGEVARRMGISTPSLYQYFAGKHALYDALFHQGWTRLLAALQEGRPGDPLGDLYATSEIFVRWSLENRAYAPLMFWRPVPGFAPTESAFAPAVRTVQEGRAVIDRLQGAGVLPPDADLDRAFRAWTVLVSGAITQQLANAPDESYENGTYSSTLPDLIAMWLAHHRTVLPPEGRDPS